MSISTHLLPEVLHVAFELGHDSVGWQALLQLHHVLAVLGHLGAQHLRVQLLKLALQQERDRNYCSKLYLKTQMTNRFYNSRRTCLHLI